MIPPLPAVDPRAAGVLRRLELDVTRRLDGLLHGDHRGLVPGHGAETGETRPYTPGDDVRRIDWNVSARSMEPHVRETIADRELETWVLADRSASLDFGTAAMTKADLATAAVAAVGFLTARTGNRLGAVICRSAGVEVVPARPGRDHLRSVLSRLVQSPPAAPAREPGQELAVGLRHLLVPPRRRGLVVVVSDFIGSPPATWIGPLRALGHRHEVVAVEVLDPRELELPPVGLLRLVDPESGRVRDVPTNRATRARYAAAAAEQRRAIAGAVRGAGAAHLRLRTDADWLLDLVRFVTLRKRVAGVAR